MVEPVISLQQAIEKYKAINDDDFVSIAAVERMALQLTHGLKGHRQIELPSAVIHLHGARGGNRFQDTRRQGLRRFGGEETR